MEQPAIDFATPATTKVHARCAVIWKGSSTTEWRTSSKKELKKEYKLCRNSSSKIAQQHFVSRPYRKHGSKLMML
jgi:hypothetical protein